MAIRKGSVVVMFPVVVAIVGLIILVVAGALISRPRTSKWAFLSAAVGVGPMWLVLYGLDGQRSASTRSLIFAGALVLWLVPQLLLRWHLRQRRS